MKCNLDPLLNPLHKSSTFLVNEKHHKNKLSKFNWITMYVLIILGIVIVQFVVYNFWYRPQIQQSYIVLQVTCKIIT